MTKKTLLLAASTAALLFGGANAFAAEISGITSVKLADELTNSATYSATSTVALAAQKTLTFNFLAESSGGFPNGESLKFDVSLANSIFAGAAVISGTGGSCSASVSISSPAAANGTSATYFISLSNCTTSGTGLAVSFPVQVTGAGDASLTAGLTSSFGGSTFPVDGGPETATFVEIEKAFSVTATTGSASVATVTDGYKSFSSVAGSAGSATIAVDSSVLVSLSGTTASPAQIAGVTLTAVAAPGSFTGYTLASNVSTTAGTTATSQTATFVYAAGTTGSINLTTVDTTPSTGSGSAIPATAITLKADLDLVAGFADATSTTPSYSIVTRDGTNFVAPWVALGGATGNRSQIRLANNGDEDTGPITISVLSQIGSAAPIVAEYQVDASVLGNGQTLTPTGGIPAGAAISIDGAKLKTALYGTGATSNVDLQIALEAQPQDISAKVRLVDSTNAVIGETSLGNLSAAPQ